MKINSLLNNSGPHGGGYHSNNDQGQNFLPEIKRVFSKSSQRTQITQVTDQSSVRRASPEALALMMKNIKNNKPQKNWVPGGNNTKQDG